MDLVGAASALPLTAGTDQSTVTRPGAPGNTGKREHDEAFVDVLQARPGWFTALGTAIEAGRDLGPMRPGAHREVVIDRTLAAEFYPRGPAVGGTAVVDDDTLAIVGVVDHVRQYDLRRDGWPQLYLRDQDNTYGTLFFALRTRRDPLELAPEVRAVMHQLNTQLAIADIRSLDHMVDDAMRQQRVSATLAAGFALGALLLAAMGLFGVVARSVARRRNEIAVRLALGAHPARVLRMLLREGGALVAIGVAIAMPGIYFAGKMLQATVIGVSPFDPVSLAVMTLALTLVTLTACYLPARRAAAIEPAAVLREE